MPSLESVLSRIQAFSPESEATLVPNPSPSGQSSLYLKPARAVEVAQFLKDDPELRLDYLSNVTGVDWPAEGEGESGFLEAVYHLYSIENRWGPLVLRFRTGNRDDDVGLPSLTPVWRSAEFQEREIYDLYGIRFEGHPDLRRILMWDEFEDHPMRRDYRSPDDYEYEPTPHDEVLDRARTHYPPPDAPGS